MQTGLQTFWASLSGMQPEIYNYTALSGMMPAHCPGIEMPVFVVSSPKWGIFLF